MESVLGSMELEPHEVLLIRLIREELIRGRYVEEINRKSCLVFAVTCLRTEAVGTSV